MGIATGILLGPYRVADNNQWRVVRLIDRPHRPSKSANGPIGDTKIRSGFFQLMKSLHGAGGAGAITQTTNDLRLQHIPQSSFGFCAFINSIPTAPTNLLHSARLTVAFSNNKPFNNN